MKNYKTVYRHYYSLSMNIHMINVMYDNDSVNSNITFTCTKNLEHLMVANTIFLFSKTIASVIFYVYKNWKLLCIYRIYVTSK